MILRMKYRFNSVIKRKHIIKSIEIIEYAYTQWHNCLKCPTLLPAHKLHIQITQHYRSYNKRLSLPVYLLEILSMQETLSCRLPAGRVTQSRAPATAVSHWQGPRSRPASCSRPLTIIMPTSSNQTRETYQQFEERPKRQLHWQFTDFQESVPFKDCCIQRDSRRFLSCWSVARYQRLTAVRSCTQ